jgi:membrane-associated phospholipid phosphatase
MGAPYPDDEEVVAILRPRTVDPYLTGLTRDGRPARPLRWGWWFDAVLVAAFCALTVALVEWPPLLRLDLATRDWADTHRPPPAHVLGLVLDHLGQGGYLIAITVGVGVVLAWRRRGVRPVLPAVVAPIVVTVLVLVLKRWTERGAPHYGPVQLFSGPGYVEYPSGHVVNGVVYYGVLALLLAPYLPDAARRLLCWLPGPLVAVGTTYVAYHWLTDSAGGYLLGLLVMRQLARIPWATLPLPGRLGRRAGDAPSSV